MDDDRLNKLIDFTRDLHFKKMDDLAKSCQDTALTIVKALFTLNGGAIVAILSFMGLKLGNNELPISLEPLSLFWVAFLLAIIATIIGYFCLIALIYCLSRGQIDTETSGMSYSEDTGSTMKRIFILSFLPVGVVIISLGFSIAGSVSFSHYVTVATKAVKASQAPGLPNPVISSTVAPSVLVLVPVPSKQVEGIALASSVEATNESSDKTKPAD